MGKGTGKGKGKGGCDFVEEGCDALEGMICCVCMLLILGPVLLVVGVVFLGSATKDDRGQRINKVKDAVTFWNSDATNGLSSFQDAKFSAAVSAPGCSDAITKSITGSFPLQSTASPADEYTDAADRFKYTQLRFILDGEQKGWTYPTNASSTCKLQVVVTAGTQKVGELLVPFTRTVDIANQVRGIGGCPTTLKSSATSASSSVSYCRQQCQLLKGSFQFIDGSGTFKCMATVGFSRTCMRVTKSGNSWAEETSFPASGSGCYVQLGSSQMSPVNYTTAGSRGRVFVEIRSARDPYIRYLQVTAGSGYFGLTQGQKVRIGLSLLVLGALLSSCWCCICWASYSVCCAKKKPTSRPQNPVQGFAYDVANKYGNKLGYPVANPGVPPPGYPQVNQPAQAYPTYTDGNQYPPQQYPPQQYPPQQYPPQQYPPQQYPPQQYPPQQYPPQQYPPQQYPPSRV